MNPLPLVAVAGSPNAGKSALFNALTGARQKVGNYPGVTVERHSGRLTLADGRPVELVDLPGAYSLDPGESRRSGHARRPARPAEGRAPARRAGDRPRRLQPRQSPALRAAADRARPADDRRAEHGRSRQARRARARSASACERELGVPVIETVAVRRRGIHRAAGRARRHALRAASAACTSTVKSDLIHLQRRAREIATAAVVTRNAGPPLDPPARRGAAPPGGRARSSSPLIMFVMFQAVFAWSEAPSQLDRGRRRAGFRASRRDALPAGAAALAGRRRRHRRRRRGRSPSCRRS